LAALRSAIAQDHLGKVDMKKRQKKSFAFGTAAQLAAEISRDPGTVSRWLKRPDWPVKRKPPWSHDDIAVIAAWAEGLAPNLAAPAPDTDISKLSPERRARLKKLIEEGRLLEIKRKREEGQIVDVDLVRQWIMQDGTEVMAGLRSIRSLALKMEGMSLQQREQLLEQWAKTLCNEYLSRPQRPPLDQIFGDKK
jgi:hypothetical protein